MSPELWGLLGAFSVAVVTYIVAPRLEAQRKDRQAARDKAVGDRKSELDLLREEQRDLRIALKEQVAELRAENIQKDHRIELLEAKVNELKNSLEMFRLGLTHPPGFILVPTNIWTSLRHRLGDQIPPGPFVGEAEHAGPQFGRVGLLKPHQEDP